nr:jacalin-related lectin 3-like [Ipomoea trifida]
MSKVDLIPAGQGRPWDDYSLGQVVGSVVFHGPSITLNHPTEFLTGVYGTCDGCSVKCITFVSNQAVYGPFGDASFCSDDDNRFGRFKFVGKDWLRIRGFYGTVDDKGYLRSLGVYLQTPTPSKAVSYRCRSKRFGYAEI